MNADGHCRVPLALHRGAGAIEVAHMNRESHGGDGLRARARCAQVVSDGQCDRVRARRCVGVLNERTVADRAVTEVPDVFRDVSIGIGGGQGADRYTRGPHSSL